MRERERGREGRREGSREREKKKERGRDRERKGEGGKEKREECKVWEKLDILRLTFAARGTSSARVMEILTHTPLFPSLDHASRDAVGSHDTELHVYSNMTVMIQ